MQADAARRQMGRPRDARADRAILDATLELIAEYGVRGFRTGDVAARAGVGKGAIYRRYRSKDALVTAAVAALVRGRSLCRTRVRHGGICSSSCGRQLRSIAARCRRV